MLLARKNPNPAGLSACSLSLQTTPADYIATAFSVIDYGCLGNSADVNEDPLIRLFVLEQYSFTL